MTQKFAQSYKQFSPALTASSLLPDAVGKAYNFPQVDCSGRRACIVELGGAFKITDIVNYCTAHGYKVPQIETVVLPGALEESSDADGEVALDIDVILANAPGAKIVVIFAPNTEAGFVAGTLKAVELKPDAISISWGAPESSWTAEGKAALDAAFKNAEEDGIFIGCASGDSGSNDGTMSAVTDYPACSPYVTACGGTKLELTSAGTRGSEVAWSTGFLNSSGSGGGVSSSYPVPGYQTLVARELEFTHRISPDIAGNADPSTGYQISINGSPAQVGGTSAVAPLYAALALLVNAKHGTKCGLWNRAIYANPEVCYDVTQGTNGKYKAQAGFDAVTGNGVVDGTKLLALFAGISDIEGNHAHGLLRGMVKKIIPHLNMNEIDAILTLVCEIGQPVFDDVCPIILGKKDRWS